MRDYIASENIKDDNRVFPLGYTRTREIVKNAGNKIGVFVKPHDLKRHAATYASRSGVPIGIVSKTILRHSNLSTTQRYLEKVSNNPAFNKQISYNAGTILKYLPHLFIEGFQYCNPSFFEFSSFNKILDSFEERKLKEFLKFYIYNMRNFMDNLIL